MTAALATKPRTPGIDVRHSRGCPSRHGGTCGKPCTPTYQAHVWSARESKRIRKTFPTLSAAKAWRGDAQGALRRGTMRAPTPTTLREAWITFHAGALDGTIRTRSGDQYKPSALRGYDAAMRVRILPDLGGLRLSDVRRTDVQDLADRMLAEGRDPSTIRNALMPLRAVFRRAVSRGEILVNPMANLDLPAVRGKRDRIAAPAEAAELLGALPEGDRALWATALYAGLRRGELMGLRWEDVDLAGGVIRVERAWDAKEGEIAPKSRSGKRTVPIAAVLRDHLLEHKLRSGRDSGLVFGVDETRPFTASNVRKRAESAWKRENERRVKQDAQPLEPITLHECRHTFASLMIAAGVNAKALSTFMGHSSITITLDRYGHLFPGNEAEAAGLLDAFLERANTQARLAQVG